MKIRKLLLRAKLEQIEKENQNIFIFHCSANAAQWRFLKNFLYNTGLRPFEPHFDLRSRSKSKSALALGNTLPARRQAIPIIETYLGASTEQSSELPSGLGPILSDHRRVVDESPHIEMGQPFLEEAPLARLLRRPSVGTNTDSSFFRFKGLTLFAGAPSLKKTVMRKARQGPSAASWSNGHDFGRPSDRWPAREGPLGDASLPTLFDPTIGPVGANAGRPWCEAKSSKRILARPSGPGPTFRPRGCLFFFDTQSDSAINTYQKNRICLELVRKIESLEFNGNLVLLYGQMKSMLLNHVDLEQASSLDTQTTYQHFFTSIQLLSIALNTCLHQKIDEFICIQERPQGLLRRPSS